jgi:peptidoglycan/LPS O-acetylase OafA/YrhL
VVLVLAFHAEVPGFGGGFLGVSLFFTLSGYLIGQLLLDEHARTGRVALRSFWARRARRLAPASLACLAAVAVLVTVTDWFPGQDVPGDVVAAALEVANWRFVVAGWSYEDLFTSVPSPVLHFWSLAIEEQFYVVFPLVVAFVLPRGGRRRLAAVLAAGWVLGSVAAVSAGERVAYYASHARAPELLAGVLLAMVWPVGGTRSAAAARAVDRLGSVGVVALLALSTTTAVGADWLFAGGLPALSLLWCAVVAAASGDGALARLLSWRPAVAVGRRSYGIYVYHWPIFLVLTEARVGVGGPGLVVVRVAATALAAWISFAWLEAPVRERHRFGRPAVARTVAVGALAAVVVLASAAPPTSVPLPGTEQASIVSFAATDRAEPLDVLVLGSDPTLARRIEALPMAPGVVLDARDGLGAAPDLVVVGVGAPERAEVDALLDAFRAGTSAFATEADAVVAAYRVAAEEVAALLDPLPAVPIVVVDPIPPGGRPAFDLLHRKLSERDLQDPDVSLLEDGSDAGLARHLGDVLRGDGERIRILVVGDSTAYEVAAGLHEAASDRFAVSWSGAQNCPLVHSDQRRWFEGMEPDRRDCPHPASTWPDAIESIRPDVLLGVASLAELGELRFGPGDAWHSPGDEAWVEAHRAGMAALQALLAPYGTVSLVATTPPMPDGVGFAGYPLGEPARLRAWLDQIERWDEEWRSVGTLDWAGVVERAEAAAGASLRVDGIHLGRDTFVSDDRIGVDLAGSLEAAIEAVRAEARATGCLVDDGGSARLDVDRCRS